MYLIQTVQTSWRPQLPVPKEIPAQLKQNSSTMDTKNPKKETQITKKWSFGRFFRKKKELDSDSSSEEDRKAGFIPLQQKARKKDKRKRGSKIISPGFDHIVVSPKSGENNELILPVDSIETTESIRSSGSADKRGKREKRNRLSKHQTSQNSSSDEDLHSQNSSSLLRYRSDESLGSGGVPGSRRSRAARTERYYKRMSRDENIPVVTQQVGRWKTQPVQYSEPVYSRHSLEPQMKPMTSMNNGPNVQQYIYAVPNKPNRVMPVSSDQRSVSYENHIHLHNLYDRGNGSLKSVPPPPPPRDPLRRVNVPAMGDIRPMSYAFDKSGATVYSLNNRCVSDDKLWGPEGSIYQTNFHRPASVQPTSQPRRFITRADRDANQPKVVNGPNGVDFKYIADAIPRSRKPIHILKAEEAKVEIAPDPDLNVPPPIIRTTKSGLPSPMQQASSFWKQIDQQEKQRREQSVDVGKGSVNRPEKPRSFSNSRASTGPVVWNGNQESLKSNNQKVNRSPDQTDNIVNGNLYLKATKDKENNIMEVSTKPYGNKSNSMPNYYQLQQRSQLKPQQQQQVQLRRKTSCPPTNKYDEYIARKTPQITAKSVKEPPAPPQRKSLKMSTEDLQKPKTNLEDAINELEAIYKSLKLSDDELLDRAERLDVPTPTLFEQRAIVSDDDEEEDDAEPDIVLDDVVYRNLKRANAMIKTVDPQPPFGIPIGPIPPPPSTDYLHVTPDKELNKNRCVPQNVPDIVTDDLAVRSLRKDMPASAKPTVAYALAPQKKKRAARSMSANIYNLIQRDAAKPSGGNLFDYRAVDDGGLEKSGSLTDVRFDDDISSTLQLLRNLRKQDKETSRKASPVFRHPSQGGAVFNLPSTLNSSPRDSPCIVQKPPIPTPRKSHSPDPMQHTRAMEEVLNRIAREAKETSKKISEELKVLRYEKLATPEKTTTLDASSLNTMVADESSETARLNDEELSKLLKGIRPSPKPRRLSNSDELLQDIDATAEAAKICEKILQNVVTIECPVTLKTNAEMSQVASEIQEFVNKSKSEERDYALVEKNNKVAEESKPAEADLIEFSDDAEPQNQHPLAASVMLQNLEPLKPVKVNQLTERNMGQLVNVKKQQSKEATVRPKETLDDQGDYDNVNSEPEMSDTLTCKQDAVDILDSGNTHGDHIAVVSERQVFSEARAALALQDDDPEDIDKIMKECEDQVSSKTPYTSLSSSDCPKSSSPASSRHKSSSITSIHAISSSDFVKSSSSEFHTPSTDPIKTFSTTSYDVNSSSPTPNNTNSPLSTTPSPLLASTPVSSKHAGETDDSQNTPQSLYNSSEELAMIFGMPLPAVVPVNAPSTSDMTTATTGKEMLALKLANNANACVAIANNHKPAVTTNPATNSTVTTIVVAACSRTSSPPPPTENVDGCLAVDISASELSEQQDQSNIEHASFVTIASFRTPESCRLIRLAPSPVQMYANAAYLDTIPEMHDADQDHDNSDVDDRFVVDNTNSYDTFSSFSNISGAGMINLYEKDADAASKISMSSNPDSGNVSLSDFPIQESPSPHLPHDFSLNASLELSLLHNSQMRCSELYPFVNRIEIQSVEEIDLSSDSSLDENKPSRGDDYTPEILEKDHSSVKEAPKSVKFNETKSNSTDGNSNLPYSEKNRADEFELRNRSASDQSTSSALVQSSGTSSCGLSLGSMDECPSTSKMHSTSLSHVHTRQGFIQHIVIACVCGVASHDFYTLIAIVFAIILLIAIIML